MSREQRGALPSTAELFHTTHTTNASPNNTQRKPSSSKHRHKPSSHYVHHVPHNSHADNYRWHEDLDHIRPHQHPAPHERQHQHHNSMVDPHGHHHADTLTGMNLDASLEIIDGDILSQKDIMANFIEERVNLHLQQQTMDGSNPHSGAYAFHDHGHGHGHSHNAHAMSLASMGDRMKESMMVGTPLSEADIINFSQVATPADDIDIEDFEESDDALDPMKLIAAKNALHASPTKQHKHRFPDTQPVSAQRGSAANGSRQTPPRMRNNTMRSPLSQIGDMTPASVANDSVIYKGCV